VDKISTANRVGGYRKWTVVNPLERMCFEMIVQYVTVVSSEDKQVSSEVTEAMSEDRKKVCNEVPCEDKVGQKRHM
jgi:hypothetical protein